LKKTRPFFPPLAAAFPVLSVYSANLSIVPLSDLWRPLLAAVGIGILVWALLTLLYRNVEKGAAAAIVWIAAIFAFHRFTGAFGPYADPSLTLECWATAALILGHLAATQWRWPGLLNLLASFLILAAIGQIAVGLARQPLVTGAASQAHTATARERPDVFYIILDGYGRSDALKRALDYDNTWFVEELRKRGFYVAGNARANYCQTELSLSSSLNMEFLPRLLPNVPASTTDRSAFDTLITDNAVAKYFRAQGYATIAVTSGFPAVRFPKADLWIEGPEKGSILESTLLQMTPAALNNTFYQSMFEARRKELKAALKNLGDLATPTSRPRFVFAHILAPHPPFVFDAKGNAIPHHGSYGFWDASDYMTYVGSRESYRQGYIGQAEFLSHEILREIDRLLAAPGRKPVVIVQGDHGSKLGLDQNSLAKTDIYECFPNLNAYFLPDAVKKRLYPGITPVNSFRLLLDGLFEEKLPVLPDRSWYSTFVNPLQFTEVTDKLTYPLPHKTSNVTEPLPNPGVPTSKTARGPALRSVTSLGKEE